MLFRLFFVFFNLFDKLDGFTFINKNVIQKHKLIAYQSNNCIDCIVCNNAVLMNDTESADTIIKVDNNNLLFYGPITRSSCFQLQIYLSEFEKKRHLIQYGVLNLHIQSQGGELLPAFYVSDYIKNMKLPVHTYIDSFAASAATLISIAGERRFMSEHSLILVHQLSSQVSGKFEQFNVEVANMNTIMELAKDIY